MRATHAALLLLRRAYVAGGRVVAVIVVREQGHAHGTPRSHYEAPVRQAVHCQLQLAVLLGDALGGLEQGDGNGRVRRPVGGVYSNFCPWGRNYGTSAAGFGGSGRPTRGPATILHRILAGIMLGCVVVVVVAVVAVTSSLSIADSGIVGRCSLLVQAILRR